MPDAPVPKVFISYSHDSPEHAARVLAFADQLRLDGIHVILDQYTPVPDEGWPLWMERNLDAADFVMMVCTETYLLRVSGREQHGKGLGVRWEGGLIRNRLYQNRQASRYIPILLAGATTEHIPASVQEHPHYRIDRFDLADSGYEALYRHITNQPLIIAPEVGNRKVLAPNGRKERPGESAAPPKTGSLQSSLPTPSRKEKVGQKPSNDHKRKLSFALCLAAIGVVMIAVAFHGISDWRSHHAKASIVLYQPNVNRVPQIVWCNVPAGPFLYGDKKETPTLPAFRISKYLVTYEQFQAFIDAPDGYKNARWWYGLNPEGLTQQREGHGTQEWPIPKRPCENVSWYEAMAFCAWLSDKLGYKVTLPTEQQWEMAARGTDGWIYPWGNVFILANCNTAESGIKQTTLVDAYPQGHSPCGALDMCGNVWEWTRFEYDNGDSANVSPGVGRALRGGSWDYDQSDARAASRLFYDTGVFFRSSFVGFRPVSPASNL